MKRVISNLSLLIIAGLIFPTILTAGKIYLKDGSVELSDRIWESKLFIHFILSGTKNVEIRFSRDIVNKIEYNDGTVQVLEPRKNAVEADKEKKKQHHPIASDNSSEEKHALNSFLSMEVMQKILWENRGLKFYDPRRNKKFWAGKDARFNSFEKAVEALSRQYNRPVSWIESHMGEENELAQIHKNLIAQMKSEMAGLKKTVQTDSERSTMIETPASKVERKRDNNGQPQTGKSPGTVAKGIHFYDPRRPEKYWSSADDHHQTFKQAIESLARQYQVTPEWIESHMGSSNDLHDIHRRIQLSLQPK